MIFKNLDERVIGYLEKLVWPNINPRTLTYPTDYKRLIDGFRDLLEKGIDYHPDDIREWLYFHQPENRLNDWVIEDIVKLAEYTRIDFFPL